VTAVNSFDRSANTRWEATSDPVFRSSGAPWRSNSRPEGSVLGTVGQDIGKPIP
jgi:hypothetical protein